MDVVREVARGVSNAEIAAHLFIADTTVKTHIARQLMKLCLRNRVQTGRGSTCLLSASSVTPNSHVQHQRGYG
jgi:ATP/maltotriose-dependent transcriptional regulator MalT